MKTKRRLRIACLFSGITFTAEDLISGICRYSRETGEWDLFETGTHWSSPIRNLSQWKPDGIFAGGHHTHKEAAAIASLGIPTITLLWGDNIRHEKSYPLHKYSRCLWDSIEIGKMAARHFLNRNFRHFAYVDATDATSYWSKDRERYFHSELSNGKQLLSYHRYGRCSVRESRDWMLERSHMVHWILALPKPCAIFAPNDRRAQQVLDACRTAGITVPDEVSILGVDNSWICESSLPTLSSIACDLEQAGYNAARHLDQLIRGETRERVEIPVSPIKVHVRQSTDWFCTNDALVRKVLHIIQTSALDPLFSISALSAQTGHSRSVLENRFRKLTGRTMRMEVEHVRLAHARDLLAVNTKNIEEIARACGFNSSTHFGRIFQARFGNSPTEWRKSHLS